jgi:hypothetical protein
MALKIVRLTKRQLIEFLQPYREAFPDWAVGHDVMLTRSNGPLKQSINFQTLGSGAYRPSQAINILLPVPDGCTVLHRFLDVKHREVLARQHAAKWPLVLKAMEEQFMPPIREPLEVVRTLRMAEAGADRDQIDNISYTTALAALNAYVGNVERSLYWCDRVEQRAAHLGRPIANWETRKKCYIVELRQALKAGTRGVRTCDAV